MGRFTLRLPETLHEELESRANREGVSLNQYIVYMLTRQVASRYTIEVVPEAKIREQRAQYEALLASLGTASLEATKAFLAARDEAPEGEQVPAELRTQLEARLKADGR